jgi:hypothetical protein
MSNNSLLKRLDAIAQSINVKQARWIVLEVDGNLDDDEAAVEALLEPLAIHNTDTVVTVKKFGAVEGLPCVGSVTILKGGTSNG